jgi:hypothetical protein
MAIEPSADNSMRNLVGILFASVLKALLMALDERSSNMVEAVRDSSADWFSAERVRKVMAVSDSVNVNDLKELVSVESGSFEHVKRKHSI